VSAAFKMWKRDPFQDLQFTRPFVSGDAYERAKLLNVLMGLALARRVAAEQVTVNLVHPGQAWTQMTQSMTSQTIPSMRLVWPLVRLASLVISPLAGVATGQYFEGKPTPKRLSARELDRQYQERAWQLGCRLVADAATASERIMDRG
jgi:NAD(P)-dependent dehydrogenase (short-subunit alcohol dehydrogenase family)